MSIAPTRRLRLLIPHDDGARAIAVGGDLPSVDIDVVDGEPTAALAARWLPSIGLHPWLVECFVDQTDEAALAGGPRHAYVETAPAPAGWTPPQGWEWHAAHQLAPTFVPGLETVAVQRLAEWRGDAEVPAQRPAWARAGWFEAARDWIAGQLRAAGRPEPRSVVQMRHWGITAVMRVDTGAAPLWFKATIPRFHAEAAITAELDRLGSGATCGVVAVDVERRWMLLDELGDVGDESPERAAAAIDRLVGLQRQLVDQVGRLRSVCPTRSPADLVARTEAVLDSPFVTSSPAWSEGRREPALARLRSAVDEVVALGLPETLVHGDFHPGNVAGSPDGPVIFDWSDACIGSPVCDFGPWASWYAAAPDRYDAVWGWFRDAWDRHFDVDVGSLDRSTIDTIAGAFHVDSYLGILESVEPFRRAESADGLDHFLALLFGDPPRGWD